jgi:hypothetical protein
MKMDIFHLKMRSSKFYKNVLISLFFLVFIISLCQNLSPIYAKDSDDKDESLNQSKTWINLGTEIANVSGELIDTTFIEIDLFTSKWNITDITLEFFDIYIKEKDDIIKEKIKEPKDINLSILIDNNEYKIEDTKFKLKKNFTPKVRILNIPYNTNLTLLVDEKLNLGMNYIINVEDIIDLEGNVLIKEESENFWNINLQFIRYTEYHSLTIKLPNTWYNLRIYRDGKEIISKILLNDNYITFSNDTLLNNSILMITANSPNLEFSVDLSDDTFGPDEKLKLAVEAPNQNGQITFELIDPSGEKEYAKSKDVFSEETTFSYRFEPDSSEGDWKIVVFWSDDANAGVQDDEIEFILPSTIDIQLLQLLIVTIVFIGAVSSISYFTALRIKNVTAERKQKILNRCYDLLNLDYVIVVEKEYGFKVYDQIFPARSFDVISFTEFLNYVNRFGIELIDEKKDIWTLKLNYKELKVILTDFEQFKTIFVLNEIPSIDFLDSINELAKDIQNKYSKFLETFDGHIKPFETIKELLEEHLQIYFLYPISINHSKLIKMNREEESLVLLAQELMKEFGLDQFYIKYLFPDNNYDSDDIKNILSLIDKGIFQPLYVN